MSKIRMKVTITGYYEADPSDYKDGERYYDRMIQIDKTKFNNDHTAALAAIEGDDVTITVEPS